MQIKTDPQQKASKIDKEIPYFLAKRIFDLCLALLCLIAASPLLLLLFLLAKIESIFDRSSRGPFIYSETRMSQGKPFKLHKIRIFKTEALARALKRDGIVHTKPLEGDPDNLTGLGKFLKKFYLDELPQLFNIVKGEMSFVGTRPWNPVDYKRDTGEGNFRKKNVKAGLTGLVQLYKGHHGEFAGSDPGLDDYYIAFCRNNSKPKIMAFDLKIIAGSLGKIVKGEGL